VALEAFDVLATPTVGTPAIPLEPVDQTSTPAGFTHAVNLLERCALEDELLMALPPRYVPKIIEGLACLSANGQVFYREGETT
jgi:hypothetical protein